MPESPSENLTEAQNELYDWIKGYMKEFQHSPTIRQMMQAMRLKSPAPIQSRLKHLQDKGFISWQEGKARTLQLVDDIFNGFTIDSNLVSKADKDAIILHCLPAYRSKEITDEIFESHKNRIFDQAENRLHAQQALLSCILQ